jgi:hypothetical protein
LFLPQSDNPIVDQRKTVLALINVHISGFVKNIPDKVAQYSEKFSSMEALEEPEEALVYVFMTLKRDAEYHLQYVIAGRYAPDWFTWLFQIKEATRTALHLSDALHEDIPGFAYGQKANTDAEQMWCLLQWTIGELARSIVSIEDCFPELKNYFDEERRIYAAVWEQHLRMQTQD